MLYIVAPTSTIAHKFAYERRLPRWLYKCVNVGNRWTLRGQGEEDIILLRGWRLRSDAKYLIEDMKNINSNHNKSF